VELQVGTRARDAYFERKKVVKWKIKKTIFGVEKAEFHIFIETEKT
jgi:hypothetical protein